MLWLLGNPSHFRRCRSNESENERVVNSVKGIVVDIEGYCELTGISSRTTHRDLTDLVKRGLLRSVGKGRSTHYILIENAEDR